MCRTSIAPRRAWLDRRRCRRRMSSTVGRIRNFCIPSSTSSRRWLNTVERSVTTPVVRPGVELGHLERGIDGVVGIDRFQEPARLFEKADQRFLDQKRETGRRRARCGSASESRARADAACRGRGNIRRRNGPGGCRRSRSGTRRRSPRSACGSAARSARRAQNPRTSAAAGTMRCVAGSKSVMAVFLCVFLMCTAVLRHRSFACRARRGIHVFETARCESAGTS